jgi:predicted DNA-binding ribbon-helix-helix protein
MKRFQSPCLHHIRINGRDTSITVEPEFWEQFRLMTMERQTTIGKLLAEIDRTGRLLPHQGPGRHRVRTLSAAARIFVFQPLMARLADAEARGNRRRPAAHRSYPTPHRRSAQFPWSLPEGMHSRPSKTTRMLRDVDPTLTPEQAHWIGVAITTD